MYNEGIVSEIGQGQGREQTGSHLSCLLLGGWPCAVVKVCPVSNPTVMPSQMIPQAGTGIKGDAQPRSVPSCSRSLHGERHHSGTAYT